jgi:citrate/tricarballylate utilization protein
MSDVTHAPFDDLFAEADRQLTICNACRYCEGYCAVFPALERRTLLGEGDITHLADLCHDCRACFTACMYAPPHEFGVNPPAILSAVRRQNYAAYLPHITRPQWLDVPWLSTLWRRVPWLGRRASLAVYWLAAVAVIVLVAFATAGSHSSTSASPYTVIPYPALLVVVLLPCAWSVAIMTRAVVRYWHDTAGSLRGLANPAALRAAVIQAASLRYLRGGGADCSYPTDDPSPARRRLHAFVGYGFLLCVASTVAAGISQDLAGDPPPYPPLSAPVILGVVGGAGMIIGCTGLISLKRRADPARADPEMTAKDYGLLAGLEVLAITGLLTLVLRDSPLFATVLVIHLAAVAVCFAIAPYTKFAHAVYRFLALVHDNAEAAEAATS